MPGADPISLEPAQPHKFSGFDGVLLLTVPATLGQHAVAHLKANCLQALADESARVLLLRGSAETFCRGMDLAEISEEAPAEGVPVWERATNDFTELLTALAKARPITVAVVEGPALGGGVGLAAACDYVLATDAATFALPELLFGLAPAMILPVLAGRLGLHRAKRWAMTQAKWKAIEANSAGLVDQVVSVERLEVELGRLLRTLLRSHPRGVSALKHVARELERVPTHTLADLAHAVESGREVLNALLSRADVRRELVAFRDYGLLPGEADA
ncbi:MAG TPA: enoyl-CoA hydratase/isomerase family protein [Polyangiaceae bacterium]|nr:enoyl-CoA hydratase/isomerase family protein [Polyangiaceae bacterium]